MMNNYVAIGTINIGTNYETKVRNEFNSIEDAIRQMRIWSYTASVNSEFGITVNGILMPPITDETFFYASVKAAKEGKVWCEMKHEFVERSYLSDLLGGCFDTGDPADDAEFWEDALWNVYDDIRGIAPVTGDSDGSAKYAIAEYAIVKDDDLAEICREDSRFVVTQTGIDEDGTPIYQVELADFDEPDYEEPEEVVTLTGSAVEVRPFIKAIYRAVRPAKIWWSGYCDAPKLNHDQRYRVTLLKDNWGYYLTAEVVKTITDHSGDYLTEYEALDADLDWDITELVWDEPESFVAEDDDEPVVLPTTRYNRFGKFDKSRWCRRPASFGFTENCTIANNVYVGIGMAEGVICRY